jgi:hypothetical protein
MCCADLGQRKLYSSFKYDDSFRAKLPCIGVPATRCAIGSPRIPSVQVKNVTLDSGGTAIPNLENSNQFSKTRFMKSILPMLTLLPTIIVQASELPEGGQHIAALTHSLDATIAAYTALEQNLDDIQPAAAVARSLTVLADDYDELCARLSQFNFWIRYSSNSAKFSQSGLIELGKSYERVQSFPANNQMSTRQQGVLGLYQSDPEVRAAERELRHQLTRCKAYVASQGGQQEASRRIIVSSDAMFTVLS